MSAARGSRSLDLSSFFPGNLERLQPWKGQILGLLTSWKGGYFFSDPAEESRESVWDFLETEGCSRDTFRDRVDEKAEPEYCVSFRLLEKNAIVDMPRCSRSYWALGGLDTRDWFDQWQRLKALDVDVILSEALPEELPIEFGSLDIEEFVCKFLHLPPNAVKLDRFEVYSSVVGRLIFSERATSQKSNLVLEILRKGMPEGTDRRNVLLFDQPQWIEAVCLGTADSVSNAVLLAKRLSPFRWPKLRNANLQNSVTIEGKRSIRSIVRELKTEGFICAGKEDLDDNDQWSFDCDSPFQSALRVSELYQKSAPEAEVLRSYLLGREIGLGSPTNFQWQYSPEFQGTVLKAAADKSLDKLLGEVRSESLKAVVLGCSLCWSMAIKGDDLSETILDALDGLSRSNQPSILGEVVWGLVGSGHLPHELPYTVLERLLNAGWKGRHGSCELEYSGCLLDAVSIWESAEGKWNYADRGILKALPFLGRSKEARKCLEQFEQAYPSVMAYRSQLAKMILVQVPTVLHGPCRTATDEVLDFVEWCLETEYKAGKGWPATLEDLAWVLGMRGRSDVLDSLSLELLPDETQLASRVRLSLAAWLNGARSLLGNPAADRLVEKMKTFEQLAYAFIHLSDGNEQPLEEVSLRAGSWISTKSDDPWRDDEKKGAVVLYGLNRVCGSLETAQSIASHWDVVNPDYGRFAIAIDRQKRIASGSLEKCMERINNAYLESALSVFQ